MPVLGGVRRDTSVPVLEMPARVRSPVAPDPWPKVLQTLAERTRHVVQATFNGKRVVIFSGGESKATETLLEDPRAGGRRLVWLDHGAQRLPAPARRGAEAPLRRDPDLPVGGLTPVRMGTRGGLGAAAIGARALRASSTSTGLALRG
ncbi:uncharacterized protein SOCE26_029240 [Sorangium cellulosum]|uniref:Uncharacterized protein n=1 Tax=Sorangium cellulosum TaxID=56 RepID=A0A2L0EQG3_SORCE|nr:uncharacterized protein SOCE26_029240 [Sorangium cellulosum]